MDDAYLVIQQLPVDPEGGHPAFLPCPFSVQFYHDLWQVIPVCKHRDKHTTLKYVGFLPC